MNSNQSLVIAPTNSNRERAALAAVALALMAAFYAGLSIFYFYEDFFRFIEPGYTLFMTDRSGVAVHIAGPLWTVLSPWRMAMAAGTVFLLGYSAISLLRGYRGGRPLALFTLWGVLVPQALWYTEFAVDWHQGHGVGAVIAIAALVAMVPTALLYEGRHTLASWSRRCASPGRILGTSVTLAWIGFFATECIDHSYQMHSDAAYAGALVAIVLSALGAYGLLRLRAWALPLALGAAASFAVVPLAFQWSRYIPSGGYIDAAVTSTTGSAYASVLTAALPLAVLYLVAGPYLKAFFRQLKA